MANHTVADQQRFLIQWFRTWSDYQKEDFTQIVAHKIDPSHFINGLLVNGIQNLSTAEGSGDKSTNGRPPSLFSCQMKLFNEWWETWKQEDKDGFTASVKDSDPKFWVNVEEELNGSRKKRDDEFYAIISNLVGDGTENDNNTTKDVPASESIDNQVVSNITTTTTVKVDLAVHNVNNTMNTTAEEVNVVTITTEDATSNGVIKEQERVRLNGSAADGVLVIEEDNDEII